MRKFQRCFKEVSSKNGGNLHNESYCDTFIGASFTTSEGALGGGVFSEEKIMRSFAEILASEQANRNILLIHLTRLSTTFHPFEQQGKL